MATVTGLTAERMEEIIDKTVVDANVVSNNLILTLEDGSTIDAGSVLAEAKEVITSAAELAALTPVDGQEIIFVADAANGVIWTLRYRADATGSFKWEFMGGSTLVDEDLGTVSVSGGTWADFGGGGNPQTTLLLGGDYDLEWGVRDFVNAAGSTIYTGIYVGASPIGGQEEFRMTDADLHVAPTFATRRKTGVTANTLVKLQHKISAASANITGRYIRIKPVRVG